MQALTDILLIASTTYTTTMTTEDPRDPTKCIIETEEIEITHARGHLEKQGFEILSRYNT